MLLIRNWEEAINLKKKKNLKFCMYVKNLSRKGEKIYRIKINKVTKIKQKQINLKTNISCTLKFIKGI